VMTRRRRHARRVRYPDNGNNTMRTFGAVDFYNLDEPPSAPTCGAVSGAILSSILNED